ALPGAVVTDECDHLARVDAEARSSQCLDASEGLHETPRFEQRIAGHGASGSGRPLRPLVTTQPYTRRIRTDGKRPEIRVASHVLGRRERSAGYLLCLLQVRGVLVRSFGGPRPASRETGESKLPCLFGAERLLDPGSEHLEVRLAGCRHLHP